MQNAYSLLTRDDEEMLRLCPTSGIAWVPFFPLGSAFAGMPKVADEPGRHRRRAALGATPAQVGLAWLLHHAPNMLLIPGTADADHLEANVAAGAVALDEARWPPGRHRVPVPRRDDSAERADRPRPRPGWP